MPIRIGNKKNIETRVWSSDFICSKFY